MSSNVPLLSLDELERLQRQILHRRRTPRRLAAGHWSGAARSLFRGRGMELDDSRAYQPGDDVRHMDWRATARSGRPMSKVFREERQRQLYLVVDRGPSMHFGTRVETKAAAAARCAAVLAFSALTQQEHVAGLIIDGAEQRAYSAARHLDGVLQTPDWPAVYRHLQRTVSRGATVCLVSDLHDVDDNHRADLWHLASRCELMVLHVVDPAEIELPAAGRVRLTAGDGRVHTIDSSDPELRARYAAAMAGRHAALRRLCHVVGAALQTVHTHRDTIEQLEGVL